MADVLSRYCRACDENWPNAAAYYKCPGCSEATTVDKVILPMGLDEAKQRALDLAASRDAHEKFEAFCAERAAPDVEAEVATFLIELDQFAGVPE